MAQFHFDDFTDKNKFCDISKNYNAHLKNFRIPKKDKGCKFYAMVLVKETEALNIIKTLSRLKIKNVKKTLKNKYLYNEHEKSAFIKHSLSECFNIQKGIIEADFLSINLKEALNAEIIEIIEFLTELNTLLPSNFNPKLKFNLNKTDLLVLIHLLYENKIIKYESESEIGFFIDNFFLCRHDDEYKNIANSKKTINDFKNGNKSFFKSVSRLQAIFMSKDFYSFDRG